jgi:hypothetical protein
VKVSLAKKKKKKEEEIKPNCMQNIKTPFNLGRRTKKGNPIAKED